MIKTRLLFIAMMAMAVVFSGCDDDDDDNDFSIIGTWEQESLQLFIKPSSNLPEVLLYEEQDEGTTITFHENGTGTLEENEEIDPFTWELSDNILSISYSAVTMNFTLGTKTNIRVTGEQSMTKEELTEILAMFDTEDINLSIIDEFPNLTATLKIAFVR